MLVRETIRLCGDCRAPLPTKRGPGAKPIFCLECRHQRRKHSGLRAYYARTGRAADLSAYTEVKCETCENRIVKVRADRRFCDRCLRDRANAITRVSREAKRRADNKPIASGVSIECKHCGVPFIKCNYNQIRCFDCRNQSRVSYSRKRRKRDPNFAMRLAFGAAIRKSLNRNKGGYSWEQLVGYTAADLVRHLERQFLPGMSWENRDKWHIDHIVPLRFFTFVSANDPDFKAAWALTNLRPLWIYANLSKGGKRTLLL